MSLLEDVESLREIMILKTCFMFVELAELGPLPLALIGCILRLLLIPLSRTEWRGFCERQ